MSERAQALDALKQLARDIGLVDDVASRRSDPDRDHQQMRARLKAWRREILLALDILEAPAAPPVGVSPRPVQRFKFTQWGMAADPDGEWCEIDSLAPVEPTPPAEDESVEPTPDADVWREIETAPKDGTRILICYLAGHSERVAEAEWSRRWNAWQCDVGYVSHVDAHRWIPLPPPHVVGTAPQGGEQ